MRHKIRKQQQNLGKGYTATSWTQLGDQVALKSIQLMRKSTYFVFQRSSEGFHVAAFERGGTSCEVYMYNNDSRKPWCAP